MSSERHLPIFKPAAMSATAERVATGSSGFGALVVTPESAASAALPVRGLDVHAKVAGLSAHTRVTTRFVNIHQVELRATYIFPLPAGAAVTAFKMRSQGREIIGKVFERGEAIERHEEAIRRGKTSALLEEEASETFTLEVGNIPPGCEIETELTLVELVPVDDRRASWRFPLVCGEKYIPGAPLPGEQTGTGTWSDTSVVPEGSRLNPPRLLPGMPNPIELGVTVELAEGTVPEGAVVDATLPLVSDRVSQGGMTLVLDPGLASPDRDLILRWQLPGSRAVNDLRVVPEGDAAGTFVATVVMPDSGAEAPPRDVVVLVDRSGSMGGWKMPLARECALHLVDQLREGDRFALASFDNHVESFMQGAHATQLFEATSAARDRARAFIAGLKPRGGTELGAAMAQAFEALAALRAEGRAEGRVEGREQAIVLLTDAWVGDERRILAGASSQSFPVPVYVVGIETSLNRGLLERLVRESGGHLAQIARPEDRDEALATVSRAFAKGVMRDVQLEAAGGLGEVSPRVLPPLVPGVPFRVAGRFLAGGGAAPLGVRARMPDGETLTLELPARAGDAATLAPVWAKLFLNDLQIEHDAAAHQRGEIEKRIVDLSCKHQVLSRFTAYLAIDEESNVKVGGDIQVTQAVAEPAGFPTTSLDDVVCASYAAGPELRESASANRFRSGMRAKQKHHTEMLEQLLLAFDSIIQKTDSEDTPTSIVTQSMAMLRKMLRELMKHAEGELQEAAAALYVTLNSAPWDDAGDRARFLAAWDAFKAAIRSEKTESRASSRHWT